MYIFASINTYINVNNSPPPVLFTIPVLVDSETNLNNSGVLIPDGMLAKIAGQDRFKVGNGKASWSELPWQTLTFENGLIEKDGAVSVDFSQMPTNKFEALLKQLRLPIWLEQDTDFYVNCSTGSDVLSEGRGLSEDKPFKTIQTCVDYVSSYNLQEYDLTINIFPGTYSDNILCKNILYSSGKLIIKAADSNNKPIIKNATNDPCISIINCNCILENLKMQYTLVDTYQSPSIITVISCYGICIDNSKVSITGLDLYCASTGTHISTNTYFNLYGLYIDNSSWVYLGGDSIYRNKIEFHKGWTDDNGQLESFIWVNGFSRLYLTGNYLNSEGSTLEVSGEAVYFILVQNSALVYRTSGKYIFLITVTSGKFVTAKRYNLGLSGGIVVSGGPNYFPGNEDGILNTATHCFYT